MKRSERTWPYLRVKPPQHLFEHGLKPVQLRNYLNKHLKEKGYFCYLRELCQDLEIDDSVVHQALLVDPTFRVKMLHASWIVERIQD